MQIDKIFGDKLVVLSGDFRQTLPVIRHGKRSDIVQASLKSSPLWHHVTTLCLTTNMQIQQMVQQDSTDDFRANIQHHSDWLLSVGEGRAETFANENIIKLDHSMMCRNMMP